MNSSIGPAEQRIELTTKRQMGLLSYRTESFVYVHAELWMLPADESPNSMTRKYGGPPYVTIEPPQKPKVGPYQAAFEQGAIELVQLSSHPRSGQAWKPNGEVSTEQGLPDYGGRSSSGGSIMREMTLRVLGENSTGSQPVFRFPDQSKFHAMGLSYHLTDRSVATIPPVTALTVTTTIACPPEAREMALEIGIADGDWKTKISFDRYQNQQQFHLSSHQMSDGDWAGNVQIADPVAERYPVSFSYSRRDDYETRLVYELPDGKLVTLQHNGGQGNMRTGLTTMPVAEFDSITKFHVQARRYQWTEFRNVSLELGHKTEVEIQDAY